VRIFRKEEKTNGHHGKVTNEPPRNPNVNKRKKDLPGGGREKNYLSCGHFKEHNKRHTCGLGKKLLEWKGMEGLLAGLRRGAEKITSYRKEW